MPPRKRARGVSGAVAAASAVSDESHAATAAVAEQAPAAAGRPAAAASVKAPRKRKAEAQEAEDSSSAAPAAAAAAASPAVETRATAADAGDAYMDAAAASDGEEKIDDADPRSTEGAQAASAADAKEAEADAAMAAEEESEAEGADDGAAAAGPQAKKQKRKKGGYQRKRAAELAAARAQKLADAQERALQEPQLPAVDSSHCPPPHGLHKDVLHTLFAFTGMRDLAHLIQLSLAWYGGVTSVPWSSLHAEHHDRFGVAELCDSPLAKQIGQLSIRSRVNRLGITAFELRLMRAHMPNLQSLETHLLMKVSDVGPWLFPANLKKLVLAPKHTGDLSTPTVRALLASVAQLKHLKHFYIELAHTKEVVDWSPLLPIAAQLEEFEFDLRVPFYEKQPEAKAHQRDFLRQLVNLRRLTCPYVLSNASVCHLLRDPMPFTRLEQFNRNSVGRDQPTPAFSPDVAKQFGQLHSLTRLDFTAECGFDFLAGLTQLTHLTVRIPIAPQAGFTHTPAALTRALAPCTQLSTLKVHHLVTSSAELATLCAVLPQLTQLEVRCPMLESLAWVAAAPNLVRLHLHDATWSDPALLSPLSLLARLAYLDIAKTACSFLRAGQWDAAKALLQPPSPLCPSLQSVHYISHPTWNMGNVLGEHGFCEEM